MGKARKRDAPEPWERQEGETEKAYEAFRCYRDMGPRRRLTNVAKKLTKSRQIITNWSRKYDWEDRARAYDMDTERRARERAIKDRADMIERHIKLGKGLQAIAVKALNAIDADGLSPTHIREFLRLGVMLEQEARAAQSPQESGGSGGHAPPLVFTFHREGEA